jgi:hypothetical protein
VRAIRDQSSVFTLLFHEVAFDGKENADFCLNVARERNILMI